MGISGEAVTRVVVSSVGTGRFGVKDSSGRSRKIKSVTHSITIRSEKLGKREVSRPTCSCGWAATWAYITEKFARDAGQEHVKQVLGNLQAVGR
jgi:hypothetical protein